MPPKNSKSPSRSSNISKNRPGATTPGADLKWWQRPVRMMRRDYVGDFERFMKSDLAKLARESRDRWHINCEWVMATPGCAPGLAHQTLFNSSKFEKFPKLGNFDMLREYLPHAKKYGVHLVPYVNMHWYSYDFAAQHPGWEQLLEDGTPYGRKHPLYGNGTTLCVNSPWRDWAFEMIREVMRTGVDGCFLDGPVIFPSCCYCETCRRLFAEMDGGGKLPSFGDWSDPLWKPFLQFRAESWANFMKGAQEAAVSVNPEAVIFLNGGGFHTSALETARDPSRMEKFQNFSGAEEFFHCSTEYKSPFCSLNLARFLAAGEKPAVVFTHHALSTWHYNPLPPAEMSNALAQTAAGGANTWFAIFMDAMDTRAGEAFEGMSVAKFLAENDPLYTATSSAAETAIIHSNRTLYYYLTRHKALVAEAGGGREKDLVFEAAQKPAREDLSACRTVSAKILNNEISGSFDAFNFAHIPVKVLWDEHLVPEKLQGVKTLVLPNMACLSDRQLAAIRAFVEAGGGLVATFESGCYDEWGEPARRPEWLKFLGIEKIEGVFAPSRVEEYMTVKGRALRGFADGYVMPRTVNALKVKAAKDAQALVYFNHPIGLAYAKMQGASEWPAVLLSKRGKGRVVYAAAPLFESFNLHHLADHKELTRAMTRLAAGTAGLQVETCAPGSVAIETRAQKGRLLVHLVNTTSEMKRPMERIIPLRDIKLSIRAKGIRRIKACRLNKTLSFTAAKGRVAVRLPAINDYELLVLE
ncbi:MAG: beta-galactosidase trimerization domain-containing protein [Verrucomicrobiae bacterium]|nr:beta-galactosidase trimerization domain-containing protein [Verrucomicrobiae bacterium]